LFIPLSFLEKEAKHVEGFAKECAVVTHHRLEEKDEPLVVRPTSETIIGDSFSRWIQSYRDLPLLLNQWANVVRWEMRPRLFLRTAEFLWQEGHTCHADEQDARKEVDTAVEMYRTIIEERLAIPCIIGEKPDSERFPGALTTLSLEAMMQDGKALQAGTSHYLGQNFAKAQNIKFLDAEGKTQFAHTTSWGVSTRLIGGMIMTHGDDDGLRVPPRVAPHHVVVIPVIPKSEHEDSVIDYCKELVSSLKQLQYQGQPLRVTFDKRDIKGGEKSWQWVKKGIPLRVEVGPRDIADKKAVLFRRDKGPKDKEFVSVESLLEQTTTILDEIQQNYFSQAKQLQENEFRAYFDKDSTDALESSGFVLAPWCGDEECVASLLEELKVTIRCIPSEQASEAGTCIFSGKPASCQALFARAY
ncbi:UNVERIFIED_CONTAM: hypothetical protein GTU68_044401, partial [Idotea baltica]|nr:hypothetical protein [Idotea baltica]